MPRILRLFILTISLVILASSVMAQQGPVRVLWWNGMPNYPPQMNAAHRQAMANYVGSFGGGQSFAVQYRGSTRGGSLAQELASNSYDILVLDITTSRRTLTGSDTTALQQFYASGRSALMLDGSFWIRNVDVSPRTVFPGNNGEMAGLLINQMVVLAEAGGGILIGADHAQWQADANTALQALVPGAQFRGTTNPSTDGAFIGDALLAKQVPVTARDILKHWESVPNQGEAPVGDFVDFTGQPITLYSLVETADKPGGGRKRPYISASVFPGAGRTAIDSAEPMLDNLPTHKGPTN